MPYINGCALFFGLEARTLAGMRETRGPARPFEVQTEVDPAEAAGLLVVDLWLEGHRRPTAEHAARSVGLVVLWVDTADLRAHWCAPGDATLDPEAPVVYVRRGLTLEAEARAIGHEIAHWLVRRRGWPAEVEERFARSFGVALAEALAG